jgi:hypothetical protein
MAGRSECEFASADCVMDPGRIHQTTRRRYPGRSERGRSLPKADMYRVLTVLVTIIIVQLSENYLGSTDSSFLIDIVTVATVVDEEPEPLLDRQYRRVR